MKRTTLILVLFVLYLGAYSQDIRIGLYHKYNLRSVLVSPVFGQYKMFGDDKDAIVITSEKVLYLTLVNQKIQVKDSKGIVGNFNKIKFTGQQSFNTIRLKANSPKLRAREYEDNLEIDVAKGKIRIINIVNLENYIAGVVESEGGIKAGKEYYKTQAILCRTYALENFHKHESDGFNLCDDVHCQAYKSRAKRNDLIVEATSVTKGLVIVDTSLSLITAAFYSNSGGITSASESVWQQPRSYLKSVPDTFSVGGNNYTWTKKIPYNNWLSYLKRNGFHFPSSIKGEDFISKTYRRQKYYTFGEDSLPYTRIRSAFKLRSTLFAIDYKEGYIILHGRGYGHGVGLSQEGAMAMDRQNYTYKEIIKFYYQNVFIVSLRALQFFKH